MIPTTSISSIKKIEALVPATTGFLTLIVAFSSFFLSFANLRESAVEAGFSPLLAWCWPICIDALLISGSLMVLRANVQGSRAAFGWGVLLVYTGISTGFNIAHSPEGWLYQASHAIPPISLCISIEVLMSIIRSDLTAGPQLAESENRPDQIREYIQLHPEVTAAELAKAFGIARQTAARHLSRSRQGKEEGG